MPNEQPSTLEFQCVRCEARLNVKPFLAGKKINCPKCHKKIQVPTESGGVSSITDEVNPAPVPPPVAAATQRPPALAAQSAPVAVADETARAEPDRAGKLQADLAQKSALLSEREREVELLRAGESARQAKLDAYAAEIEQLRSAAQNAVNKSAEQEARANDASSMRLSEAHAAELERVKRQMADLEKQVVEARKEADAARAKAASAVLAAGSGTVVPSDEGPDPDQLIAAIQGSTLRRGMRISVLSHVIVLLITSLGFIYWSLRGGPPEPEAQADPQAEAAPETQRAMGPTAREEAVIDNGRAPAAQPPPSPQRPRSPIEEAVESLPEPGELPQPSAISLDPH